MPYFLFPLGDQGDGIANSVRCTSMSSSSISNEEKYGSLGYFLQATHLMCKSNKVGRGTTSVAGRPDVQGGDRKVAPTLYLLFVRQVEAPAETLDTTSRVKDALLTSEEWMAV